MHGGGDKDEIHMQLSNFPLKQCFTESQVPIHTLSRMALCSKKLIQSTYINLNESRLKHFQY